MIRNMLEEKTFLNENQEAFKAIMVLLTHGTERVQSRCNEVVNVDSITEAITTLFNDKQI